MRDAVSFLVKALEEDAYRSADILTLQYEIAASYSKLKDHEKANISFEKLIISQ